MERGFPRTESRGCDFPVFSGHEHSTSAVVGCDQGPCQTGCGPSVPSRLPPYGPLAGMDWTVVVSRDLRLRRACDVTRMFKKIYD